MGECKFCDFSQRNPDMFDEENERSKRIKSKDSLTSKDGKTKIEWGLSFSKSDNTVCKTYPDQGDDYKDYRITAEIWINESFGMGKSIHIKYCPMCGRKLMD